MRNGQVRFPLCSMNVSTRATTPECPCLEVGPIEVSLCSYNFSHVRSKRLNLHRSLKSSQSSSLAVLHVFPPNTYTNLPTRPTTCALLGHGTGWFSSNIMRCHVGCKPLSSTGTAVFSSHASFDSGSAWLGSL